MLSTDNGEIETFSTAGRFLIKELEAIVETLNQHIAKHKTQ